MGAPRRPREPPTTSTDPAVYFVDAVVFAGTSSSADAGTSAGSCARGRGPIGAMGTDPAWNRPAAIARPTFAAPNVTVAAARTAAPGPSPVDAFTPEGTSTATTGRPLAFTSSIIPAASSR